MRGSSSLPFQTVRISTIENKTVEPNIEDLFYKKLAQEFQRQGIRISNSSDYILSGVIKSFSLSTVSEKNKFSNEYQVLIAADFVVTGPDGIKRAFLSKTSPFFESFVAPADLNSIVAQKELATDKAIEDLARAVMLEIIYREP